MSADPAGARFSAVVVNYNGEAMLGGCVRSVLQEGVPAAQIIIVDNGSRDDSIARLEREVPGTRILRNPCNAGFARAVNQGLAEARGDFALLLNNDAQLEPGALRAFAEAFDRIPGLAIAGAQLRYADGRLQNAIAPLPTLLAEIVPRVLLQWMSPRRFRGKTAADVPIPVEGVIGACLVARRSVLARLGLMDEDYFFFLEETEWCQRALRLGFQVYHVPAAKVLHGQGQTAGRFHAEARIEFQRSKLIFFRKNRSRAAYLFLSALLPVRSLVNAVANTVLCLVTICAIRRLRVKTRGYWRVTAWHLLGRPAGWGLPGKCPQNKSQPR
jgi:GT2 family glycosyltransferase